LCYEYTPACTRTGEDAHGLQVITGKGFRRSYVKLFPLATLVYELPRPPGTTLQPGPGRGVFLNSNYRFRHNGEAARLQRKRMAVEKLSSHPIA
jgi:hypothetical protein